MATDVTCLQCGKPFDADVVANRFAGVCPSCLAGFARDTDVVEPSAGVADPSMTPPLKPGGTFHGLEVIELLGAGGMGVVYKARHPGLDRFVALKILSPKLAAEAEFASRFNREARALAALSHPNIVQVYDVGREGDLYFLTMEYVDGVSLRQLMKDKRLSPQEALAIVPQICEALEYAHAEGVVHRDIKPENLLFDRKGRVKIADFGLAKLVGRETQAGGGTLSRVVMGTPGYMAPEQLMSMKVDHRADIYSLGAVFYEMLTGEIPLGRFGPPSQKVQLDVRLDEIVLRALEKEPDRRYQRASDFKTGVQTYAAAPAPVAAAAPARIPDTVWLSLIFLGVGYFLLFMGLATSSGVRKGLPLFFFFHLAAAVCAIASLVRIESRHPRLGGRPLAVIVLFFILPPLGIFAGSLAMLICAANDRRRADPRAPGVSTPLVALLAIGFFTMLSCAGCIIVSGGGGRERPAAIPPPGRGMAAPEHGPTCAEIAAAGDQRSSMYIAPALESIAKRPGLTTHEQMHLIDVTLHRISTDMYREDVLTTLARNPGLTREGRDYLYESLKSMSTDLYRGEVLEALRATER